MINLILRWVVYSLLVIFTAWLVPGISVENFLTAMLVCLVIALINIFIRPLLEFISLPVTFLTLGLFSLVINAALLMLAGFITPGFQVEGFLSALIGSIVLSLFGWLINRLAK